jgi:glycosyltransferase involved in cell wall biosynthesis
LNVGLRMASGSWIARQDADDWSEPDRIARQVEFFAGHRGAVLCGTAAWTHQHDGSTLWRAAMPCSHGEILRALQTGNPFFHGSAMFLKGAALAIGGYREEFRCAQDYDFFWRLTESGEAANLCDALYHYRYAGGSVSVRHGIEQARAHRAAQRLVAARRGGETEDVARAFEGDAEPGVGAELKQVDHVMLAGNYRLARRLYWDLVRRNPSNVRAWGKLARWGVFVAAPAAREWCFR